MDPQNLLGETAGPVYECYYCKKSVSGGDVMRAPVDPTTVDVPAASLFGAVASCAGCIQRADITRPLDAQERVLLQFAGSLGRMTKLLEESEASVRRLSSALDAANRALARPHRPCPKCAEEGPAVGGKHGGRSLGSTFFCPNCQTCFSGNESVEAQRARRESEEGQRGGTETQGSG